MITISSLQRGLRGVPPAGDLQMCTEDDAPAEPKRFRMADRGGAKPRRSGLPWWAWGIGALVVGRILLSVASRTLYWYVGRGQMPLHPDREVFWVPQRSVEDLAIPSLGDVLSRKGLAKSFDSRSFYTLLMDVAEKLFTGTTLIDTWTKPRKSAPTDIKRSYMMVARGALENKGIDPNVLSGDYSGLGAGAHCAVGAEELYRALRDGGWMLNEQECRRLATLWILATINDQKVYGWNMPQQSCFFDAVVAGKGISFALPALDGLTMEVKAIRTWQTAREFDRSIEWIRRHHRRIIENDSPIDEKELARRVERQVGYRLDAFSALAITAHLGAYWMDKDDQRAEAMRRALDALYDGDRERAVSYHQEVIDVIGSADERKLPAKLHNLVAAQLLHAEARSIGNGQRSGILQRAQRYADTAELWMPTHSTVLGRYALGLKEDIAAESPGVSRRQFMAGAFWAAGGLFGAGAARLRRM